MKKITFSRYLSLVYLLLKNILRVDNRDALSYIEVPHGLIIGAVLFTQFARKDQNGQVHFPHKMDFIYSFYIFFNLNVQMDTINFLTMSIYSCWNLKLIVQRINEVRAQQLIIYVRFSLLIAMHGRSSMIYELILPISVNLFTISRRQQQHDLNNLIKVFVFLKYECSRNFISNAQTVRILHYSFHSSDVHKLFHTLINSIFYRAIHSF